jgi:hypothetical protein
LEVARKAGPTPAQPEEISTRKKEAAKTTKYLGGTVKSFGGILLGIAFVVGITLAAAFYIRGLAWVSEHVIEYLIPTVVIAISYAFSSFCPWQCSVQPGLYRQAALSLPLIYLGLRRGF